MPEFAGGKIEAYVGPNDLGAPDDLEAVIINIIDDATASLDIAVQELDNEQIANAILAARGRGVRVSIVLEQSYLREEKLSLKDPPRPLDQWQW